MNDFFKKTDQERAEWYKQAYLKENKSWIQIAKILNTYPNKVRRDANSLEINSRDRSEAQKIALNEGRQKHPTEGKQHSSTTKQKISESQGKVWDSLSQEEKEYRSKIGEEAWNSKSEKEKEEFFRKSIQGIQKASKEGSKMENFIFNELIKSGFTVEKHKEHILQNEKFHIDLYVAECQTAIEVDGPMHFEPVFGEEKLQRRQAADSQKTGLILASGMKLIRVKLIKRESQRYLREVYSKILSVLRQIQLNVSNPEERYYEI